LEAAHGVRLRFADGRELLCGTSGLWNVNLGYGNEAIADATARALRDASYLGSWGYENVYSLAAAEAIVQIVGLGESARVLFSTSGGAANDLAMKVARHYQVLKDSPDRRLILGLRDGFHGMTFGAFALTDGKLGQEMYGVDRRLVGHIPANDIEALRKVMIELGNRIAAVTVEPVIGTAAVPLDPAFVSALLDERDREGFLLIADEISTGFGRIGPRAFATQSWERAPDIVITAKALTNGTQAASAVVVSGSVAEPFCSDTVMLGHAETQAGTAVAAAAILATIDETRRLRSIEQGAVVSVRLDQTLGAMPGTVPLVSRISGKGCLRAIHLANENGGPLSREEIPVVIDAIREAGATVHPGPGCVQLLPALVYDMPDLEELLSRVAIGITNHAARRGTDSELSAQKTVHIRPISGQREPVTCTERDGMSDQWIVTGYDAYKLVAGDPRFSADHFHPGYPSVFPVRRRAPAEGKPWRTYSGMDAPDHAAHRRLVAPEFKVGRIAELRPWVERLISHRLDLLFQGRPIADLEREFAVPISVEVIRGVLGIPEDRIDAWTRFSDVLVGDGADRAAVAAASAGFRQELAAFIAGKNAALDTDLTSRLIATYRRESRYVPEQVLEFVGAIFLAGLRSTASMIALGALTLLEAPDAAQSIASGQPDAVAPVVDELLRFHSIADRVTARVALEPVDICGHQIHSGDGVVASTASANRDPAVFDDPNTFDPRRSRSQHVAFGYGPHRCLGEQLARLEIEMALSALFSRFPGLVLATGHPRPGIDESGIFRSLNAPLMVTNLGARR
jgi:adenosylmethionine-8-amino-7-oxononanoate aminotransferase/cytochrome P450